MSYDGKKDIVHCFSCNASYDLISLYALDNNLDNSKDFKKILEDLALKYNVDLQRTTEEQQNRIKKVINAIPKKEDYTKYIKTY